jgi:hypothetical protein
MKAFRGSMLRPLLASLREERWLLDVELLVLMHSVGARSVECPIDCYMRGGSSLVFGLDPLRMAVQLIKLRSRLRHQQAGGHESSPVAGSRRGGLGFVWFVKLCGTSTLNR